MMMEKAHLPAYIRKQRKEKKERNKMNKKCNKQNETLVELLIGIISSGLVFWLIFMLLTEKKLYLTLGILVGLLLALLAAGHMYWSLNRAMDLGEGATKFMLSQNMVRYGVIVCVFGVLCLLDFGNPLGAFAGIMCLKTGAYLQPFTHKIITKFKRR